MKLYIVRHGRTTANASGLLLGRADPELDDVGRAQAASIAAALPTDLHVVASPLLRTRQTAAAITADHEIDDRLLELDYGEFDLQPTKDIPAETWAEWRGNPEFRPPGGETLSELFERVAGCLAELAATNDRDIAVVTHVSPIKAAVAWALGAGVEVSWRSRVSQASITKIEVGANGPSLHGFNDVAHLP